MNYDGSDGLCPFGHQDIDKVNFPDRWYIYCYTCNKKFFKGDE